MSNPRLRYGSVAMSLHWIIALGVLLNIGLGLVFVNFMSHRDPSLPTIIQLHKSIGLTVLALSVLLVAWRLANPVPPLPATMPQTLKVVARTTHFLLYFLILFIPLTGWALVSFSTRGSSVSWFGLFHWPYIPFLAHMPMPQKKPLHHDFMYVHIYLAFSAIALALLHIAGALYHLMRGDDVMQRMVPGTRVTGET
ncbi:MAG: cytochrome b [Rhizomicrobium sp.]